MIRNDLTELQQAIHHAKRKQIYEQLYPETKNGAKGGRPSLGTKSIETDKLSVSSTPQGYAANAAQSIGRCGELLDAIPINHDRGNQYVRLQEGAVCCN